MNREFMPGSSESLDAFEERRQEAARQAGQLRPDTLKKILNSHMTTLVEASAGRLTPKTLSDALERYIYRMSTHEQAGLIEDLKHMQPEVFVQRLLDNEEAITYPGV